MQNVLSLFRYLRFSLSFLVLQAVSLYFYFTSELYPSMHFANSTSGISSWIIEAQNNYTRYFGLVHENEKLQKSYKMLLEISPKNYTRLAPDLIKINDTTYKQTYSFIKGDVLRATTHKANNFITANIGKIHGVQRGMGVINQDGLVGYVYDASEHYCLVKTLLSENINIDVSLNKSGQFGLLKWPGMKSDLISITGIPNDIKVEMGELVVTRGTGGVFPRGIAVGRVRATEFSEGESNWDLRLKPSVNFNAISCVFIVNHLMKEELHELESSVE